MVHVLLKPGLENFEHHFASSLSILWDCLSLFDHLKNTGLWLVKIFQLFILSLMCVSCSVMSDSLRSHWVLPARLLHPCDFPGKNTAVGCHFLLQLLIIQYSKKSHLLISSLVASENSNYWETVKFTAVDTSFLDTILLESSNFTISDK